MFCYHKPSKEMLYAIATYGCEAGNVLLGIRSNGMVSGCSFMESSGISVFDLPDALRNNTGKLAQPINFTEQMVEPCKTCAYLDICKGGCHGVSEFLSGNFYTPDPECPIVVEYNK
jgi:radical SAM protein with 4Fe4S-binding SPASM domain